MYNKRTNPFQLGREDIENEEELQQQDYIHGIPDLALQNIWEYAYPNPRVQEELDYKSRNFYGSSKNMNQYLYNLRESRIKNLPTLKQIYENTIFMEGEEPNLPFCEDVTTIQQICTINNLSIDISSTEFFSIEEFNDKIVKIMNMNPKQMTHNQLQLYNYLNQIYWNCNCLVIDIPLYTLLPSSYEDLEYRTIRKRLIKYKRGGFSLYDILLLLNQEYIKEYTQIEKDSITKLASRYEIIPSFDEGKKVYGIIYLIVKYDINGYPYLAIDNINYDYEYPYTNQLTIILGDIQRENLRNRLKNIDTLRQNRQNLIDQLSDLTYTDNLEEEIDKVDERKEQIINNINEYIIKEEQQQGLNNFERNQLLELQNELKQLEKIENQLEEEFNRRVSLNYEISELDTNINYIQEMNKYL